MTTPPTETSAPAPAGTEVEVRILDQRLRHWGLPRYQTGMSAAIDLHACLPEPLSLHPGTPAQLVPSGIAIHLADPTLAAVIVPRSGAGHAKGLVLGNLTGVIDADYLGEILISVWNRNAPGTPPITINPGDRIAQMMVLPVIRVALREVEHFTRTSTRGEGRFGSTG